MSRRRTQAAETLAIEERADNPGAGTTVLWAAGAAALAGGVTYFVLREIYARQVLNECLGQLGGLQGASPSTSPVRDAITRRVREIL